ncbi:MAG: GTP pyrophosphokinase family protein [Lachnospiraceae bacterium]|nr:GTP pyrophosphokinase family protein [Robinsoniella sp.]MDY3766210.1 GTP pyrophosphokinase family protein [Lachnospiraceae bacterium]
MIEEKNNGAFLEQTSAIEVPEQFLEQMKQYEELIMMYRCAIREVQTKLEILNDALSVKYKRNPINFIKSRIKSPGSIVKKLERRGLEVSIDSVEKNLNDVAGIRVVCHFIDDIYDVAEMLARQDDLKVVQIKDYIKNPKPNGYRSYHMIVEIPVFLPKKKKPMRVEVQIRTIAMDFWASLDHQVRYKKDIENTDEILEELRSCAEVIASTDDQMQRIRKKIEKITEERRNIEKITKHS